MNRDEIIDYFKEYEKLKFKIVERELEVPINSNFIISIIGPRRAGKTYFLLDLYSKLKNSIYLNFEDTRLSNVSYKEVRDIMRLFIELYGIEPKYLLLDEIQEVDGWEKIIRELHDLRKYKIFITGSSSKLLSKEIATKLRGRSLSYFLLPFSFREFLKFKKIEHSKYMSKNEKAKLRGLLREYLEYGGFPDVIKSEEKIGILKEYSDLILFRDFVERHKIRNLDLARILHYFMLQNFSKEVSINEIFNRIKVNIKAAKDTVYEYVTKLEDTMFFFFLRKYTKKAHLRETWPKKIYLCDTGLAKVVKFSTDYGKLMENAVFLELFRTKNKNKLLEFYYFPSNDYEVDFIVKEGQKIKQLIQVTYSGKIKERELKSLIKASKELKCKNLLMITWDYKGEKIIENNKIKFIPLLEWLIKERF